jgi:putative transposase
MRGNRESESSWREFFTWLKQRGLSGVDIVVSDSHSGLVKALQTEFQGCTWQRCQTPFMRNLLDATPQAFQEEVYQQVRAILDAPDLKTARLLKDAFVAAYAEKAPTVVQVLEGAFDDVTAVLVLPERYRRRLRTTNGVERLNAEIRRRERVIRIFPNRESVMRLLGA